MWSFILSIGFVVAIFLVTSIVVLGVITARDLIFGRGAKNQGTPPGTIPPAPSRHNIPTLNPGTEVPPTKWPQEPLRVVIIPPDMSCLNQAWSPPVVSPADRPLPPESLSAEEIQALENGVKFQGEGSAERWWESNKGSIMWGGGERDLPWCDLCKDYQEEITRLYQEARK